jgi:hypothetical protein
MTVKNGAVFLGTKGTAPSRERQQPALLEKPVAVLRFAQGDTPEEPPPSLPTLRKKLRKYTALAILGLGAITTSAAYTTYTSVKNLISTHTQLATMEAEQEKFEAKYQAEQALKRQIVDALRVQDSKLNHDAVHRIAHLKNDRQKVAMMLLGFELQTDQMLDHQSYLLRKIEDPDLREAVSKIFQAHRALKQEEPQSASWFEQLRTLRRLNASVISTFSVGYAFSRSEFAETYRSENN